MDYYREQSKLHREIMDRWFGYYLLMIGTPFPILGGLLQTRLISSSSSDETFSYLGAISLFFFCLGLIYLCIHTRQRVSSVRYAYRISPLEIEIATEIFIGGKNEKRIPSPFTPDFFGADFWKGFVHIFVNSTWLVAAVYLGSSHPSGKLAPLLLVIWILAMLIQLILQQIFLHRSLPEYKDPDETMGKPNVGE